MAPKAATIPSIFVLSVVCNDITSSRVMPKVENAVKDAVLY